MSHFNSDVYFHGLNEWAAGGPQLPLEMKCDVEAREALKSRAVESHK